MPEDQMYRIIGDAFRKRAAVAPSVSAASETLDDDFLVEADEESTGTVPLWLVSSGSSSVPVVCFIDSDRLSGAAPTHISVPVETLLVHDQGTSSAIYDFSQAILEFSLQNAGFRCINWKELPRLSGPLTATLFSTSRVESIGAGTLTRLIDVSPSQPATLESHLLYLQTTSDLPYAKELAGRLQQIADGLKEDEDEPLYLAENSVGQLIAFLESNPGIARPMLATSPNGHVMAKWTWRTGRMSIHFYPGGRAEYFLSTPNPKHPGQQDIDSSITTSDALGVKLGRLGILEQLKA